MSATPDRAAGHPSAYGPGPDSEMTWLLHRAAQRMRAVTGAAAAAHGCSLRDHIVLSAVDKSPGLTQIELGRALGIDKTTLTSELDRLTRAGLVERRVDPRDRRARVIALTDAGDEVRAAIAADAERAEAAALAPFDADQVAAMRAMLFELIGTTDDPGTSL
ncbi:MarR family transcriptional regulator [Cellulomonas sp. ES6]|uniref:MarR family winged helix-turn-helix transcriptional regulator n=1 Tax=Cellulomonas sp. ES6 TaxID=3039384 RepID=UPI0024B707E8|nr:MarR family transcriptional regulator [Cellulomonas sp. ES6]WHP17862.1 MarR family transcriptional regulator [Cellulomonas sp. ES6]